MHERNFPATDLEKGWIIDSGASAHMTPFKKGLQQYATHIQDNLSC